MSTCGSLDNSANRATFQKTVPVGIVKPDHLDVSRVQDGGWMRANEPGLQPVQKVLDLCSVVNFHARNERTQVLKEHPAC